MVWDARIPTCVLWHNGQSWSVLGDWWFGMQGIAGPGGLCFHSCRMGGEFWHEVCVVVGVVVGQGLMSVFVGVFSMFSGCPPPISQETISNIA